MFSLTIEDGEGQVAEHFSFDHGSYVIGRQDDCDIVLPSSSVSREHAELYVDEGRCYIRDLQSANGVTVDGQRVLNERHLGTASQIRLGDFTLYLEYQEPDRMSDQDVRSTLFISDGTDDEFKLVRINDEFAGEEFILSEVENSIGRTDDNFILLSDESISRQHATIERRGDQFILEDLNSSNGTRVNGTDVTGHRVLESGDVLELGNVEFVFAPGDEHVDPSEYQSTRSTRYLIGAGMVTLVLVGLVLGGLIALLMFSLDSSTGSSATATAAKSPNNQLEDRLAPLIEEGRRYMENKRWSEARQSLEHVLKIAPDHSEAKQLLSKAQTEQKAAEHLDEAVTHSENGEWRKAKAQIGKIPGGTHAHSRSRSVLRDIEQNLAHQLRLKARDLMDSESPGKLKKAHAKLVEAYSLLPDSKSLRKQLEQLEGRLDEQNADYTAYEKQLDD